MVSDTELKIGVITVRGMDYHPTRRLAEAALERGHMVFAMHPYHVRPVIDEGRPELAGLHDVGRIDAVLPRQGAEIKAACLPLIGHLELMGVAVVNGLEAVLTARNQFFTLQRLTAAGLSAPRTVFAADMARCREALADFGEKGAVVKPVAGRQGTGIQKIAAEEPLNKELRAELDAARGVLVQQFIAPLGRTDIRVLVVGEAVAGAIKLSPKQGDFRANYHLSGKAEPIILPSKIASLAVRATRAVGLDIAGVDIMVDDGGRAFVAEVNYAPGFKGLEKTTGLDIAGKIIDYTVSVVST